MRKKSPYFYEVFFVNGLERLSLFITENDFFSVLLHFLDFIMHIFGFGIENYIRRIAFKNFILKSFMKITKKKAFRGVENLRSQEPNKISNISKTIYLYEL